MKPLLAVVSLGGLVLGLVTVVVAARARRAAGPSAEGSLTGPALAAGRLAWLGAAWLPVFWLALRAEVAAWPGLTCVLGVTRLGTRAGGVAAALPWLLATAALLTAAVVAATGAWIVLHHIQRAGGGAVLARRTLGWMVVAGVCAIGQGAATIAWAAVPREAPDVAAGCCTTRLTDAGTATTLSSDAARSGWAAAFLTTGAGATVLLWAAARSGRLRDPGSAAWPALLCVTGASLGDGAAFSAVSLAPARLGLPAHECAFCLLDRAPENWLGAAGIAAGAAFALWARAAARASRVPGAAQAADRTCRALLSAGALAVAGGVVLGAAGRWLT